MESFVDPDVGDLPIEGTVYVHGLQPNQYVGGSKPLNARERRIAWPPDFAHRRAAERGYPSITAGEELRRIGVPFRDLTRIFEAETGTIYVDPCCHYNQRGNDMLSSRIAGFVAASMKEPQLYRRNPGAVWRGPSILTTDLSPCRAGRSWRYLRSPERRD